MIEVGSRVRILVGMHGGRVGTVLSLRRGLTGLVAHVSLQVPVLVAEPDGEHRTTTLPYGVMELGPADDEAVVT